MATAEPTPDPTLEVNQEPNPFMDFMADVKEDRAPKRGMGTAPRSFAHPGEPSKFVNKPEVIEGDPYLSTEAFSTWGITTRNGQVNDIINATVRDPEIAMKIERIIQQFPTISPELAAALTVGGQLDMDDGLLDTIIRKDAMSQDTDNWLWNGAKGVLRNTFIVAEDLYNLTPQYVAMRTSVNMRQGESLTDSLDQSLKSTARNKALFNQYGMGTNEGDGLIPSLEVSPQSPEFWAGIKLAIEENKFEGSPEEQLIQAINEQKLVDLQTNGINAFQMATDQWESTVLHKSLDDGQVLMRPVSYGSMAAMPFTTPGTRAYNMTSATFDITARLIFEPTDVLFDSAFRQLGKANTLKPDSALFAGRNFNSVRAAMNETFNIKLHLGAVPDAAGDARAAGAAGRTGRQVDQAGNLPIDISVQGVRNHYKYLDGLDNKAVWDINDPYAAGYIAAGFDSPAALKSALDSQGGLPAYLILNVEHELVHDKYDRIWYEVVTIDGEDFIDYNKLSDNAPQELKDIAVEAPKQLQYEMTAKVVDDTAQELKAAVDDLNDMRTRLRAQGTTAEETLTLNTAISSLESKVKTLTSDLAHSDGELAKIVTERKANLGRQTEFVETYATTVSAQNMKDGSWSAAEIYKASKAKAGITQTWRPWVNPKLYSEWLMGKKGKQILQVLKKANTYDKVDNVLKGQLTPQAKMRIVASNDTGEIARLIGDGMKGTPLQRPKIGRFYDLSSSALDGWDSSTAFSGGTFGAAARRLARRAGAQGGYNILSVLNPEENLRVISSLLKTAGVDEKTINRIQKLAIRNQHSVTGIAIVNDQMMDAVVEVATRKYGLRAGKETKYVQDQWRLAERNNRIYRTDAQGNIRGFYHNGKMYLPDPDDPLRVDITGGQAAQMESQFVSTSIITPNARQIRRLTSRQRQAYEAIRRTMPEVFWQRSGGSLPLGLESSTFMRGADWSFGIWRDLALMRAGWALRILPEEHLRVAASGYATMFNNPVDYFIALQTKMDIKLPGEQYTIAEVIGKDGLGTAVLRSLEGDEAFTANSGTWVNASFVTEPDLAWAGTTRAYVSIANDEITSRIARDGVEKTLEWLKESDEGKRVIERVVGGAATDGGLDMLNDPKILSDYLDSQNLYIAEHTGGTGIYKDRVTNTWRDRNNQEVTSFRRVGPDGKPTRFNDKQSLIDYIVENGGETPLTRTTRPQLESMAADIAGYNIDELENTKKIAHVTVEGNEELVSLMGYKTLGDINIDKDMPFDDLRTIDGQLKEAFEARDITPTHSVPVPAGELIREGVEKNAYRNVSDQFFKWLNAVPSTKYNRSPLFNQAMGYNVALAYAYASPELRLALDAQMASNPSLRTIFDLGKKKLFRDENWKVFPEASLVDEALLEFDETIEHINNGTIPESHVTDANHVRGQDEDPGRYSLTPITVSASGGQEQIQASQAFFEKLYELGARTGEMQPARGFYSSGGYEILMFDGLSFQGGKSYVNKMNEVWDMPIEFEQELFFALGQNANTGPINFYQFMKIKVDDAYEANEAARRNIQAKYPFSADRMEGEGLAYVNKIEAENQARLDEIADFSSGLNEFETSDIVESLKQKWIRENLPDHPDPEGQKALMRERAQSIYDSQRGQTFEQAGQMPSKSGGQALGPKRALNYIGKPGIDPTNISAHGIQMGNVPTGGVYLTDDFSPSQNRRFQEKGDLEQTRSLDLFGLAEIPGFDRVWGELSSQDFPYSLATARWDTAQLISDYESLLNEVGKMHNLMSGSGGSWNPKWKNVPKVFQGSNTKNDPLTWFMEYIFEADSTYSKNIPQRGKKLLEGVGIKFDGTMSKEDMLKRLSYLTDDKKRIALFNDTKNSIALENIFEEMDAAGVKLTDEQRVSVKNLWESHPWAQNEITVSDYGVMPVAMFEEDQFRELFQRQIMFTSNNALADTALYMDTYLEDITRDSHPALKVLTEDPQPEITGEMILDGYTVKKEKFLTKSEWADEQYDKLGYMPDQDELDMGFEFYMEDTYKDQQTSFRYDNPESRRNAFNNDLAMTGKYNSFESSLLEYSYAEWFDSKELRAHWRKVNEELKERIKTFDSMRSSLDDEPDLVMLEQLYDEWSDYTLGSFDTWDIAYGNSYHDGTLGLKDIMFMLEDEIQAGIKKMDSVFTEVMVVENSRFSPQSPFFNKKVKKQDVLPDHQTFEIDAVVDSLDSPYGVQPLAEDIRLELIRLDAQYTKWMDEREMKFLHPDYGVEDELTLNQLRERAGMLRADMRMSAAYKFEIDMDKVPFQQRQETAQRMLGVENYRYNWMETGSPHNTVSGDVGLTPQALDTASQVESILQASKEGAISEVKDMLYDLSNKSNIADAYRLLFPFGDAWYEVLSRWAKIMNPAQSGSQPMRNTRRLQVSMNNARKEGWLSTNEYGEEVFNWPGLAALAPGPLDGTPAGFSSQMPISSLMFIDPSARGVAGPSMSPWVQLGARIAQPTMDAVPRLRDIANFAVYGGAEEYMPGKIQNVGDVAETFMPTTVRRMWAAVFGDENRAVYGNTKMRLLEALFASGDPRYNAASPGGVREAWRVADSAGTWLSVLRIVDSWFSPGQPQYQPQLQREIDLDAPPGDPTISVIRMANEYRHANDLWGRSEADLYMIERFDVNPVVLQGMTAGFVEQPSTWEAVNYFAANKWILDLSPITAAAVVPRDTETFSQRAWQNQSIDRAMIDGVEGPTFRGDKNAYQIASAIQRSWGYEQLRAIDARYDKKLQQLRYQFGSNYASNSSYRIKKKRLDKDKRNQRADIMAQYPVVESKNAGDILGETQGSTGPMLLQELTRVGTVGSEANTAYRQHVPEVAKVAETLTRWFKKLEDISKAQEQGTASPIWWLRSTTDKAEKLRETLAQDMDGYLQTIGDEQAHDYAVWMAKRIVDPLLQDWEWINNEFAPQIDSFPTILMEESRG